MSTSQQLESSSTKQKAGPIMRASSSGDPGASTASVSSKSNRGATGGPSLLGLMASKRLAKQFASKVMLRRKGASESMTPVRKPPMEPTYRMEPTSHFQVEKVKDCIKNMVDMRMHNFKYTPKIAAMMTKILTSEIKDAVKKMAYDRYKIVCIVLIGQKTDQDVRITSRCSWDPNVDTSASYTWSDANTFCSALVYGEYHE